MNTLERIGLSPYEAKCYIALLRHGSQKGKDLADLAGVPRTSVYPNLKSLEAKGFVTMMQKDPKIYQAKDPEIAINAYSESQSKILSEKAKDAIAEAKAVNKLVLEQTEENVELLSGTGQSYKAAKLLEANTKKELLIIGSGSRAGSLGAVHGWIDAAKRGVGVKIIFESVKEIPEVIAQLKKHSIPVREKRFTNMALIVSDRKITHYAIKSEKLREGRIVMRVEHKDFSEAQAEFFNKLWKTARRV
jgi:sugar-specific transcriptional regulator TrmB